MVFYFMETFIIGREKIWHVPLRGYWNSYQKVACFVLFPKITNTFLKNNIYILQ